MTDQNTTDIHIFEKAGLGLAPFKFLYVWSMPSVSLLEANPEAYKNAMESAEKFNKGGCALCGHYIVGHYVIRSADNKIFAVGSECVNKTGDAGLISNVKAAKKAKNAEIRAAKLASEWAEKKAKWAAEAAEKLANWISENDTQYVLDFLEANAETSNFFAGLLFNLKKWGSMSEAQVACVDREIAKRALAASRPATISQYVGVVKGKISLNVTVDSIIVIPCEAYCYGAPTSKDLITMTDDSGNKIVWFTSSFAGLETNKKYEMTATVKSHQEYKGEAQTSVIRAKFLLID
jgi:hypothetical protein